MTIPSRELPEWATAAAFPAILDDDGDPEPWSEQPPRVSTGMDAIAAQGHIPKQPTDAEQFNDWLGLLSEWITYFRDEAQWSIYGDGSDGDWQTSVDGNIPNRVTYYDDLTIDNTQSPTYTVFVRGTLTITAAGLIDRSGSDGGNATSGPPDPGAGGSGATNTGKIGGGSDGGAGGDGGGGADPGTAGNSEVFGIGGDGGAGGSGGGGTGGAGGSQSVAPSATYRTLVAALQGLTVITGTSSPALTRLIGGGGGGGGGAANAQVAGGGGGGGGGVTVFVARRIVLEGSIDVSGGDGGDANNDDDLADEAGGGGGGGGGVIVLVTRLRTGSGTLVVAGGAGGAGVGGGGDGTDGAGGEVIELVG